MSPTEQHDLRAAAHVAESWIPNRERRRDIPASARNARGSGALSWDAPGAAVSYCVSNRQRDRGRVPGHRCRPEPQSARGSRALHVGGDHDPEEVGNALDAPRCTTSRRPFLASTRERAPARTRGSIGSARGRRTRRTSSSLAGAATILAEAQHLLAVSGRTGRPPGPPANVGARYPVPSATALLAHVPAGEAHERPHIRAEQVRRATTAE